MCSKMFLFSAIFAVVALLSANPQRDDNPICSRHKSIIESVLNCTTLMPSLHMEIIKECNLRVRNVEEDERETLLELLCVPRPEKEGDLREITECVDESFKTRGIDDHEPIGRTVDCMVAVAKAAGLAKNL